MGRKADRALAILNGAVGDYLARNSNGLATRMQLVARDGAEAARSRRVVLLVHGLMSNETVWTMEDGTDYGSRLESELAYSPLYLRYNTGRAIADNGADLAGLLQRTIASWPVPIDELLVIGFSMGGLVFRSACHVAVREGLRWPPLVRRAIYLGTPHLGAPLERAGRIVAGLLQGIEDPYARLAAELVELRSDGVKDLGHADLRHEDRGNVRNPRHPVPLITSIRHYLIAGTVSPRPLVAALFGDSVVPIRSATDGACVDAATMALPPSHVRIVHGISHLQLPRRREVYEHIRAICAAEEP
jgi:pimeloyl-ACP methyl ester carboxylesterase